MQLRNFVVIFVALASLALAMTGDAASGSRIYKTVDENGNVVFTDIPPKEGERGESVAVESPNTFQGQQAQGQQAAPGGRDQWIVEPEEGEESEEEEVAYLSLSIASPGDDEAVRENAGNVTVITAVEPELKTGHRIRVLLDGTPEQEGPQTSFLLTNVDRGTHAVSAEIVDDSGNVLMASSASTFHLLRVAAAPRPSPAN